MVELTIIAFILFNLRMYPIYFTHVSYLFYAFILLILRIYLIYFTHIVLSRVNWAQTAVVI